MTRPGVSVVMPFAGSAAEAAEALASLERLHTQPDDELILSDNAGLDLSSDRVSVVAAAGERSPSHARNVGAEHAACEWILFLDADCRAVPDLIDRYFAQPPADDVGALAGEVVAAAPERRTLAARYGAARSFLGLQAHLSHPYLPRAAAANLLVRRQAFAQLGGFYEGVRAAEDTDFSWRLQRAGWRLLPCPGARVEHRYRTSLAALRRQWRGYAAGRAWLARRYLDFEPEPALTRAGGRLLARLGVPQGSRSPRPAVDAQRSERRPPQSAAGTGVSGRVSGSGFAALDAVLGIEELRGFLLSNRPVGTRHRPEARVVLVADRFPARGDPLSDFARTLTDARVEAVARPESFDPAVARVLVVDYREDDGTAVRALSALRLLARHPLRCMIDRVRRGAGEPGLAAIAPAVLRLRVDPSARIHALGGPASTAMARRLAFLAGRRLEEVGSR